MNSNSDLNLKLLYSQLTGRVFSWHYHITYHYYSKIVLWFVVSMSLYRVGRTLTHESIFEIIWTVVPGLVLVLLAIPSIRLLYSMDLILYDYEPIITIKVIGHQWFWSYEYIVFDYDALEREGVYNFSIINFESYLLGDDEFGIGYLRLLEVDNPLLLPTNVYIRFLVTSVDVLHSWAVPSLGLKVDAVPGRLNQLFTFIKRVGEFYGQCSELCGVNHGFMPIKIISTDEVGC